MTNNDKIFNFRLPEDDFELFKKASARIGLTPSKMLRLLVTSTIIDYKKLLREQAENENGKTIFDNKL